MINIFSNNSKLAELLKNEYLKQTEEVAVFSLSDTPSAESGDYNVFIVENIFKNNLEEVKKAIGIFFQLAKKSYKSVFIFPAVSETKVSNHVASWARQIISDNKSVCGVICLDAIAKDGRSLAFIDNNESKTYIDCNWALDQIVLLTFSMQGYGKLTGLFADSQNTSANGYSRLKCSQTIVCPKRVNIERIEKQDVGKGTEIVASIKPVVQEQNTNLNFSQPQSTDIFPDTSLIKESVAQRKKLIIKPDFINLLVKKLIKSFKIVRITKSAKPKSVKKYIFSFFVVIALYLALPYLLFFVANILLKVSFNNFFSDRPNLNTVIIRTSFASSNLGFNLSETNKKLPVGDRLYFWSSEQLSNIGSALTGALAINQLYVENLSFIKILVSGGLADDWNKAALYINNLEHLHAKIGFLQSDTKAILYLSDKYDLGKIEKIRSNANSLIALANKLEEIMAKDSIQKYAVLVEDDNSLSGSGGEVTALAIIEISGGKLTNITTYNTNYVRTKPDGEIDTPGDFLYFYSKDDWNLSSVNWFSDFTTSAKAAEWFIDKNLDLQVGGVLGISKSTLQSIIDLRQKNIFGSTSATSKSFNVARNGDGGQEIELLIEAFEVIFDKNSFNNKKAINKIADHFRNKSVRFYLNNNEQQNILEDLGVTGDISLPTCADNCYVDMAGISIIAPFDVDRFQKEVDVSVSIEEGIVKKRLTLFVKNQESSVDKVIVRALSGENSGHSPITIVTNDSKAEKDGYISTIEGIKHNQIETEFESGITTGVSFYWEEAFDLSNVDTYLLKILKQSGIKPYNLSLSIKLPNEYKPEVPKDFTLTDEGVLVYNTSLLEDATFRINWIKD